MNEIAPILSRSTKRSVTLDEAQLEQLTEGERENLSATIRAALTLMIESRASNPLPFSDDDLAIIARAVSETGYSASPRLFRILTIPGNQILTAKVRTLSAIQAYTLADLLT